MNVAPVTVAAVSAAAVPPLDPGAPAGDRAAERGEEEVRSEPDRSVPEW